MSFDADFSAYCATHGMPDRVELMLCDLNAILRGKWIPGDQAGKLTSGGLRLPFSTYAPNIMGYDVDETGLGGIIGDPDGTLIPVAGTLKPVPWVDGNVAQVLVEITDETGGISPLSPRSRLARMVQKCADQGLHPVMATELEFYIIQARDSANDPPVPVSDMPGAQNFDLAALSDLAPILTDILDAAATQDIPTDTLIAEYGPGQFEVNFHHTKDPLAAADAAILFRRLVSGIVGKHGYQATFMAKPYADTPGNGMHVHVSMLDGDDVNIFSATSDDLIADPLRRAVSGVLNTMRETQTIYAPHLNSLRRFRPGAFAPTAPTWGVDHRSAAIRLPATQGPGARLEHRIPGADANPYLVLTAILGGILHGLQNDPPLAPALDAPDAVSPKPLAHDWQTTIDIFAQSDLTKNMFGEDYHAIYTAVRRDEIKQIATRLTEVEYAHYLSRF